MKRITIKKSILKAAILLFIAVFFFVSSLNGQDKFNVTRLTFDPGQEGFATWSPDSKKIIYQFTDLKDTLEKNGLWKISPDGTGKEQIFKGLAEHAKWSPDGKYIVFDADTGNSIKIIPAEGGTPIIFLPDSIQIINGGMPCWSPDGLKIAFRDGRTSSLCVAEINTGKVVQIFRQEGMNPLPGCWTIDGKNILIALMEKQTRKCTLWKISSDGNKQKQITGHHENFYRHLALSPDGSMLVYAVLENKYLGLWIMPAEGGKSIPLSITPKSHNEGMNWSPDGKQIAFTSTRSGSFDICLMDVDINQLQQELRELNK